MRVAVLGAGGRMGKTVCGAVAEDPDLELVAAVDPHHAGIDLRHATGVDVPGVMISPSVETLADVDPEVAVDFTEIKAARGNLKWCSANGVHAVVGTTGFTDADLSELRAQFTAS